MTGAPLAAITPPGLKDASVLLAYAACLWVWTAARHAQVRRVLGTIAVLACIATIARVMRGDHATDWQPMPLTEHAFATRMQAAAKWHAVEQDMMIARHAELLRAVAATHTANATRSVFALSYDIRTVRDIIVAMEDNYELRGMVMGASVFGGLAATALMCAMLPLFCCAFCTGECAAKRAQHFNTDVLRCRRCAEMCRTPHATSACRDCRWLRDAMENTRLVPTADSEARMRGVPPQ